MEENKADKSKLHFIIIIVLAIFVVFLVVDKFMQKKKTDSIIEQLDNSNTEKLSISKDLKELYDQYDGLKTENDTINARLASEKKKIAELMDEIKYVKSSNAIKINEYKKEVKTLRTIMRSYIVQIDSLNTNNKELRAEVSSVKKQYQNVLDEKKNLNQEIDSLSGTVDKASTLKAMNILASGINSRGKDTKRIKKIDKIKVCFTIDENVIAGKGKRWVYVRIAKPNGVVLKESEYNLFDFQGKQIVYTAKREVNYDGNRNDVCIYWKKSEILDAGMYVADVFADGKQIGNISFSLK